MNQSREPVNGFDLIVGISDPTDIAKANAQQKEHFNKYNQILHQVFEQNPQGKELLNIWKEALIITPTVTPHSTQFQAGIEEGKKEFTRNILLAIKSVEGN